MERLKIFIGYDPRLADDYRVAVRSLYANCNRPETIEVYPLILLELEQRGLYTRPTMRGDNGQMYDSISGAPMATEFALSRFLVPYLCAYQGHAVFVDSDVLFRGDVNDLLAYADDHAVRCVQHDYSPANGYKMDGQQQTDYPRKNWSSVMLFNCAQNMNLTPHLVNDQRGLWLQQFGWLEKEQIGELPLWWNWLEGEQERCDNPLLVHYTRGTPRLLGYEHSAFASEWGSYHC